MRVNDDDNRVLWKNVEYNCVMVILNNLVMLAAWNGNCDVVDVVVGVVGDDNDCLLKSSNFVTMMVKKMWIVVKLTVLLNGIENANNGASC